MELFLEDRIHNCIKLYFNDATEWHWRNFDGEKNTLVVSNCPNNYPATAVFVHSDNEDRHAVKQLLREGWEKRENGGGDESD